MAVDSTQSENTPSLALALESELFPVFTFFMPGFLGRPIIYLCAGASSEIVVALLDHMHLGSAALEHAHMCTHVRAHTHTHTHTHTLTFLLLISRTSFEILAYFCFLCGTSKHIDFKTSSRNFDGNCI